MAVRRSPKGLIKRIRAALCRPLLDRDMFTGFIDPGGDDVHTLVNNGTTPAETIAVQILPKDAPRKTPAPPPANCQ